MIIITVPPERFCGEVTVPGDKSITHRAAMLGAENIGELYDHYYRSA